MDPSDLPGRARSPVLFYLAALLWLPAGLILQAAFRFGSMQLHPAELVPIAASVLVCAPLGLPLPLACRWLWRKGYPRAAWVSVAVLAPLSVVAALFAGLLGPVAIAIGTAVLSLPVWIAAALLSRRK